MRSKFVSRLNHLSGLTQLENFYAWEMRLFATSFIGLSRLKRLDLNRCDFKAFARDSFKHIANLEILNLWDPRNYDHIDFSHLYSLQCLEIAKMTNLPRKLPRKNHIRYNGPQGLSIFNRIESRRVLEICSTIN
jgi:hypothetical protein